MTNDTKHAAAPDSGREAIAMALRTADWSGVSIGNKALISAAIAALSQPAPAAADAGLREALPFQELQSEPTPPEEAKRLLIRHARDTLASLMLRYGEQYDYDNATTADAVEEAEEIIRAALAASPAGAGSVGGERQHRPNGYVQWVKDYRAKTGASLPDAIKAYEATRTSLTTPPAQAETVGEAESEAAIYEAFARYVGDAAERPADFRMFATGYHAAVRCPAARAEAAEAERDAAEAQNEALHARLTALAPHGSCACSYDTPGDVCAHHSPQIATLTARLAEVEATAARAKEWRTLTAELVLLQARELARLDPTGSPPADIQAVMDRLRAARSALNQKDAGHE